MTAGLGKKNLFEGNDLQKKVVFSLQTIFGRTTTVRYRVKAVSVRQ